MAGRDFDVAHFGSRALLVAVLVLPACILVDDPSHCANRDGDATCVEEYGQGWACSVCERGAPSLGCSDAPIEAQCRFDAGGDGSSSGSGGSGGSSSGDGSTTGPLVECEGTGAVEGCPDDRPYCVEGACNGCEAAGGHDYCAGLSEAVPQCNPAWGHCVECYDDASPACGGGEVCGDDFACGPCTRHEQCPMSACNLFRGTCMDGQMELWVDDDTEVCVADGPGTEAMPLCDVDVAVDRILAGDSGIVRLRNGSYESLLLPDCASKSVAVLGESMTSTIIDLNTVAAAPAIEVACGSELMLHRVRLRRNTAPAVRCHDGGKLSLQEVLVDFALVGVEAVDCRLHSLRSRFLGLRGAAIAADDDSEIVLRNDVIAATVPDEGAPYTHALTVVDSDADLRFVTLVDNDNGNLTCSGASTVTAHSVLVADTNDAASIDCVVATFDHSVVDESEVVGEDNVSLLLEPTWFDDLNAGDYRLVDSEGTLAGIGRWDLGDPRMDLEGAARVEIPGAPTWPGADQP